MTQILRIEKKSIFQKKEIVNNFKKLTKRKKGASVEDEILHGE